MAGNFYSADPVLFESVSNVTATPSVGLGYIRVHDGEVFEYVYAVGCISMGCGAVYSGTSGHSVVATGAVSGEYCAGFAKHESITTGTYGWLMKKGVVDAKNTKASSAPVINEPAYMGSDGAGFFNERVAVTSAVDHGHVIGKILSAGASGGTGASLSLLFVNV